MRTVRRHQPRQYLWGKIDLSCILGVVLEGMRPICTLSANLSALAGGLQIRNGPRGKRFYRVDYDVYVYFGGTQLHAKLQWKEGVGTFACRNPSPLTISQKALCESEVKVMPYIS